MRGKALVRAELTRLANLDGLARDLFEKVSRRWHNKRHDGGQGSLALLPVFHG